MHSKEIRNLNYLSFLDLSFNRISRIGDSTTANTDLFDQSCLIENLNFSHNLIDDVNLARVNFNACSQLKLVNLSSNQIGFLQERLFDGLALLEAVDLSGNSRLRAIEPFTFTNLASLKTIFLMQVDDQSIVIGENFVSNCGQLKFVHVSSFELVWSNRDTLAKSLQPVPTKKKVNNAVYFYSINIIVDSTLSSSIYFAKNDNNKIKEKKCELVIWMLQRQIQINLLDDVDFEVFLSNCYSIDLLLMTNLKF